MSLTLPFLRLGNLNSSFLFIIDESVDLLFSIVFELILSKEKDGLDLILSGVLKSLSWVGLNLASTDDRKTTPGPEGLNGSLTDTRFALSQLI